MNRFPALLLLLALLSAVGCSRGPSLDAPATAAAELEEDYQLKVDSPLVYTQPTQFKDGFGVHARANGAAVIISAINNGTRPVAAGPLNFALITGPNRSSDLIVLNPVTANLRQFPAMRLEPGDRGVFTFTLNEYRELKGALLVFRNLDNEIELPVRIE